ncbi:MAG: sigma-70 family RNA polymerase sigma factor [Acidimicrobiaceae bacterium]|nr:sigma-70 family RNA polymerase sigma factor [Acidimicrobiaceae bacterium]MYJ11672.1 sigma-70 family RNA polymerase sigma factor [Gemmatimonadota bacterium]
MEQHSGPDGRDGGANGADLESLFVAERVSMVRLATLMVGSRAMAEEVVQDAFASVSERWDGIDRPGAYLRTAVVNGCAQILRRRSAEDRHRPVALENPSEIPERLIELRSALDRLSDRQRIVVVLRYFVDMPDDEIAQTLDVRPSTVRSLAHRALAVLRRELR